MKPLLLAIFSMIGINAIAQFTPNEEVTKKIKTLEFETNSFKSDIKRFTSEQSNTEYLIFRKISK